MFKLSQSCAIVLSYSFQYIFYCMVCCWWNCVIYFPTIRKQNMWNYMIWFLRDRPFNLQLGGGYGFLLRSEFFFRTTRELEYLFFLSRKAWFFFQNLTLGYMTKTLNQIIFFPPPISEYFFQQHWESEYFFRKKP